MTRFANNLITITLLFVLTAVNPASAEIKSSKTLHKLEPGIQSFAVFSLESLNAQIRESGPTAFNFKKYKRLKMSQSYSCLYRILKVGSDYFYSPNAGILEVNEGIVSFRKNLWTTGGMSDSSYLQNEGNLIVDQKGRFIGKIPIFHKNVKAGMVAEPPKYDTELNGKHVTLGELDYVRFPENEGADIFRKLKIDIASYMNQPMQKFEGEHVMKRRGGDFHLHVRHCKVLP